MAPRAMSLAMGLVLASACAGTKLAQVWKAPDPGPRPTKVLVVAVVPQEMARRSLEGEFAQQLQGRGLEVGRGSDLAPEGKPLDRAGVEALVRRDGFDAVLVSRYAGTKDSTSYVPVGPTTMGFYGAYDSFYGTAYGPGQTVQNETVSVETLLYRTEGEGRLVWSTLSETFNPTSPYAAINELGGAVMERMVKDGVL